MAYDRDITEGLPYVLSNPNAVRTYALNGAAYDISINGLPFFIFASDETPYIRQTAQYRKDQVDQSNEPGEQTLTGWWLRSQSSFHQGKGINFYDPSAGETVQHRFADSDNVDVWTKGQVTLLKETANMTGVTTGVYKVLSIVDGSTNKILGWTPASTTIKNYTPTGTAVEYTHVTGIGTPLDTAILAIATDGTHLFIADNDHIYTGPIATPTAGYSRYYNTGSEKVVLGWVKQRLVACIGASVYELTNAKGSTHSLPATPTYTHPNDDWTWSSISEGGSAIYAAGYAGGTSAIYKFVLSTAGVMPTLTSGIVAAQLPIGEIVYKIESYFNYLMIGTNKGMRVASISDTTGDLSYGPLIFEDTNGVRDFAFRDKFVWATGTVNGCPGLYRVDLGVEIESLRFAYAKDTYLSTATGYATTVDFVGNTEQIAFTTSGSNGIAIQSTTVLSTTGSITTGKIRYNTLENKVFKFLTPRIKDDNGRVTISSISDLNNEFLIGDFAEDSVVEEVSIGYPIGAQEHLAFKFTLYRSSTDSSTGAILNGYQIKSLPAIPRQRVIQYPLACYDNEKDKFNVQMGYENSAYERLSALEAIENTGDTIRIDDFRTGESYTGIIEQVLYTNRTPPDKKFSGVGGILQVTIRSL